MRRVQAGDRDAKEDLYCRLREPLMARIQSHPLFPRLRASASAEDLLSDVYARCEVTRAFESFEETGPRSVRRFLGTVVHCALVDAARRRLAARRGGGWSSFGALADDGHPAASLPSPGPTPTSDARASELVARIRRALSDREWEAWRLREIEGLDVDDIAARSGATRKAIWSLLQRARVKLLAMLEAEHAGRAGRP